MFVVTLVCVLGGLFVGVDYVLERISYIPEKIDDIENTTPYIPPDAAKSIVQYLPQIEGILFGFSGLIFVHTMSSSKSLRQEVMKELYKVEMEQFKYVAEAKDILSESSSQPKKAKIDYDFLIQMCQEKMIEYIKIYKGINEAVKVGTLIEAVIVVLLGISFFATFLANGRINENIGLDVTTFRLPIVLVLGAVFLIGLSIISTAVNPVEIEEVIVEYEKELDAAS